MPRGKRRSRAYSDAKSDLWRGRPPTADAPTEAEIQEYLAHRFDGWRVKPDQVVLKKQSPKGKPNPYRTRWATVGGEVFVVESDRLDGVWEVRDETEERFGGDTDAWMAFIKSDAYRFDIAWNLAEAREIIAAWASGKQRPKRFGLEIKEETDQAAPTSR